MVYKRKTRWFDTERQAENWVKKNKGKIITRYYKPTVQGNAVVFIRNLKRRPTFYGFKKKK